VSDFIYTLDADAICQPFSGAHVFRHGWGRCVCGEKDWPGGTLDLVTRERLGRAEKALAVGMPSNNPLWRPWAMDLADDVRALVEERDAATAKTGRNQETINKLLVRAEELIEALTKIRNMTDEAIDQGRADESGYIVNIFDIAYEVLK
jgi:hypothetical protein